MPNMPVLCLYYASTIPTMPVLCLLCLYYAYYACTMPTMPIYNHPSLNIYLFVTILAINIGYNSGSGAVVYNWGCNFY